MLEIKDNLTKVITKNDGHSKVYVANPAMHANNKQEHKLENNVETNHQKPVEKTVEKIENQSTKTAVKNEVVSKTAEKVETTHQNSVEKVIKDVEPKPVKKEVKSKDVNKERKQTIFTKQDKDELLEKLKNSGEGKMLNVRSIHNKISSTDFSAWFKRMQKRYNLIEGTGFKIKKDNTGRRIDYIVSVDTAIKMISDKNVTA